MADEASIFAELFEAVRGDNAVAVERHVAAVAEHKLDVDRYDDDRLTKYWNRTALSYAAEQNLVGVARLLLAAKASTETRDRSQQTVLHFAAWGNFADMTRLLLDNKADVAATDWSSMTPLHTAAVNNSVAVAELLIAAKADVHSLSDGKQTALHVAAHHGAANVAQVLFQAKCNPRQKARLDMECLDLALQRNQTQFVEWLKKIGITQSLPSPEPKKERDDGKCRADSLSPRRLRGQGETKWAGADEGEEAQQNSRPAGGGGVDRDDDDRSGIGGRKTDE